MLLPFPDPATTSAPFKQLANFSQWAHVTVQVLVGSIRLGDTLADISQGGIGANLPGMLLTVAATVVPFQFWWIGELWGVGVAGGQAVAVLYFQDGQGPENRPTMQSL
jgi:hypothetical protein